MSDFNEVQILAERYLDEMLEAERKKDYELWIKRFDINGSDCPEEGAFHKDVKEMNRVFGSYQRREFLGFLSGVGNDVSSESVRFIWKGIFSKAEVLIDVRLHKKNGSWFINRNSYSL